MRANSITSIRQPRLSLLFAAVIFMGSALASCSSDSETSRMIRVPSDQATIQDAVNKARSGDLVLIEKGVYS
jgi:hypothetical protein